MATYPVVVVDLSWHNEMEPDGFKKLKDAGVVGVILKASEGTHYTDPTYRSRQDQARRAGLLVGAYHFANGADPIAQAKHFLRNAYWDNNTLLCLDWEDPPPRPGAPAERSRVMSVEDAKKFCEYVYQVTGQRPVIYSGNTAKRLLGNNKDPFFGQHRLWLASYTHEYDVQNSWEDYWLWQFTGDNLGPNLPRTVPGVKGNGIDLNTGDPDLIEATWTGGKPNKINTGVLPDVDALPSVGVDDVAATGVAGAGALTAYLEFGIVAAVVAAAIVGGIWWYLKSQRKK